MTEKIRILFLSANPWTTSRILVDEEAREIFERLQEGRYRERFQLFNHAATRPIDLQRLLFFYRPHIVHFSGHGSKKQKLILGGTPGRGKTVDTQGLVKLLSLYNAHLRLVVLNACFTKVQARLISEVIDYAVGTGNGIGDKAGVAFAGALYRALGFGRSIRDAFDSAKAELCLTKMPRTQGIELFVRDGLDELDRFPQFHTEEKQKHRLLDLRLLHKEIEERAEFEITVFGRSGLTRISSRRVWSKIINKSAARGESSAKGIASDKVNCAK
jgi:CHAT domain